MPGMAETGSPTRLRRRAAPLVAMVLARFLGLARHALAAVGLLDPALPVGDDGADLVLLPEREHVDAAGVLHQELEQVLGTVGAVVDQQLDPRLVELEAGPGAAVALVPGIEIADSLAGLQADQVEELVEEARSGAARLRARPLREVVLEIRVVQCQGAAVSLESA